MLRGGLIGCGYAAERQLSAWAGVEGAAIVAVADRVPEKAQRCAEAFGIPAAYGDYRAMLAYEALDFVDIATRPDAHRELVCEAAQHGLHVLCQKPIAPTLADLRAMIAATDDAGVRFMVNENARFQPWFRHIRALLDDGTIGEPFLAHLMTRFRGTLPEPDFGEQPYFAEMRRLIVYEMGTHWLDTLRYLLGEAESVYAHIYQRSDAIAGDDMALLMLRIGSASALVDLSWATHPTWDNAHSALWGSELRLEGRRGTLHLRHDGTLRVIRDDGEQRCAFDAGGEAAGYRAAQQHFVDCLNAGTEPETSGRAALRTMELVFGAYDSAAHNRVYHAGRDLARLNDKHGTEGTG